MQWQTQSYDFRLSNTDGLSQERSASPIPGAKVKTASQGMRAALGRRSGLTLCFWLLAACSPIESRPLVPNRDLSHGTPHSEMRLIEGPMANANNEWNQTLSFLSLPRVTQGMAVLDLLAW